MYGDLTRPASLERAFDGADTVFHLAARAAFERYERARPTIVGGSLALMEAARSAGVERFVYASSLLVHGSSNRAIAAPEPRVPAGEDRGGGGSAPRGPDSMGLAVLRLPHRRSAELLV